MRFIATTMCVGLSVVPALAQSITPDGRPINPDGMNSASPPGVATGVANRVRILQPRDILPGDDPFGTKRDPAGRPIKPDGIGERDTQDKRGS